MTNREKAKIQMLTVFESFLDMFPGKHKPSKNQFKKITQSSMYGRHQGNKEIERRKKRMEVRLER